MENWLTQIGYIRRLLTILIVSAISLWATAIYWGTDIHSAFIGGNRNTTSKNDATEIWQPPLLTALPPSGFTDTLRYGKELIAHTAAYLGPEGSVAALTNGMNCQNCHLDAGTKPFGNNYAMVASTYPRYRPRSGTIESLEKRVNDCFERSLNGQPIDTNSYELKSMVAYIKWVGKDVQPGTHPAGAGMAELAFLARRAAHENGKLVYDQKCQTCHGANGEGLKLPGQKEYQFPPLWGPDSYNEGAGLYRLSNFARYVHPNMPLGASFDDKVITAEEAWDLAAYVNAMPHPKKDLSKDWPDISKKPIDHPFGPYADSFSEEQHKFGPFQPIKEFYAKIK
jgi:thiosulfate dehydrogenase